MRGSIKKRGASSWRITFDVASDSGKRRQRTTTVRGTYKDAQKELTRLLGLTLVRCRSRRDSALANT
jgi:hypothetical protein